MTKCRLAAAGLGWMLCTAPVACGQSLGSEPQVGPRDPDVTTAATPLAFVGVNVVPMTSNTVLTNQTIVVRGGRIESIGPATSASVPEEAVVVEGGGRYVMPALIDMHVHVRRADLDAYVAAGVGTVRNMWGTAGAAALARDVEAGVHVGPSIVSASPGLDGQPPQWPGTVIVTEPNEARSAVQAQASAGWAYLKIYTRLTPAVFDSVMAAARSAGLIAVGHVPLEVDVQHAIDAGMRSIEHLTGYDRAVSRTRRSGTWGWGDADMSRFALLAERTASAGVWNSPTLAIYVELAKQHPADERDRIVSNRRRFVLELSRAGARLLLGTDAGIDIVVPGTSVHDELGELVAAGLTPYDALRTGTTSAAEFLGRTDIGHIAVGARADLVLLRRNPLANIRHAREIDGGVLRGAWRPSRDM
jgi:imidazolonepropionase-like amidohydrolase